MGDPEIAKVHIEGAQRVVQYRSNLRSQEFDTSEKAILFWLVQLQYEIHS